MLLYELDNTTLAAPLRVFYPECDALIADAPKLHHLMCLRDTCHRNSNCPYRIITRLHALFNAFPMAQRAMLYFPYRHRKSIGAAMFWRDLERQPSLLTDPFAERGNDPVLNLAGWAKFRKRALVVTWEPPVELFSQAPVPVAIATEHQASQLVTPRVLSG